MALTGIQIFKLLPKTNCKECGVPTLRGADLPGIRHEPGVRQGRTGQLPLRVR